MAAQANIGTCKAIHRSTIVSSGWRDRSRGGVQITPEQKNRSIPEDIDNFEISAPRRHLIVFNDYIDCAMRRSDGEDDASS